MSEPPKRPRRQRSDAARNREHILDVAGELLPKAPNSSMDHIARQADVARGTLYRHFPTREDLLEAVNHLAHQRAVGASGDKLRPAGELARASPTPLSVADVLNKVPPHLLGEQIVAEAHRIRGVSSSAVYLVDLNGEYLIRLAGPQTFPERMPAPLAVGIEIPREGLPALEATVSDLLAGAISAPLLLRGRAIGVLVATGGSASSLAELAYEAAAALGLAQEYTDDLDTARRARATSPAAEIQQNLLPPRIVRTSGALIAGNVLPGYEIGGDWFDYAENPNGTWIGIADTSGSGTRSAALASVALGAFRAARHRRLELPAVIELMDQAVRELGLPDTLLSATIASYNPPTRTLSWITCGNLGPIVIDADGTGRQLTADSANPIGHPDGIGPVQVSEYAMEANDRVVLASEEVIDRADEHGPFGVDGIVDAVRTAPTGSAAGALSAIEAAVRSITAGGPTGDATLVVLVPVAADG